MAISRVNMYHVPNEGKLLPYCTVSSGNSLGRYPWWHNNGDPISHNNPKP